MKLTQILKKNLYNSAQFYFAIPVFEPKVGRQCQGTDMKYDILAKYNLHPS
jgi:hypothetical protein